MKLAKTANIRINPSTKEQIMLTVDMPRIARPNLHIDGAAIRSAAMWQIQAKSDGFRGAKKAARAYAEAEGQSVILWASGNVTVYAMDRKHENGMIRLRFADQVELEPKN
jgi:hypothetical protein